MSKLKLHMLYLLIGRGSWWSRGEREGAAKAVVQSPTGAVCEAGMGDVSVHAGRTGNTQTQQHQSEAWLGEDW